MDGDLLISVIIVGYNAGRQLSFCLDSIYNQSYGNFEVIFVNNGSTDDTELILKLYPEVKLINNKQNEGFCFANNQGINTAKGTYIFTLNSDVVLDRNFLMEMRNALEFSKAALFAPKMLKKDGATIDSTGLILSRFYRFLDRGSGSIDNGQNPSQEILGPCAAAALYSKEMLEDIKYDGEYFDEDFFFLGEDFDLAWRAKKRGWKTMFVPQAICYHQRNSSNFNSRFRQYLSFRNRSFLLIKNGKIDTKYFPIFILYDLPRFIYMLCTNRYTWRALYEIIRYTPKRSRKRYSLC